MRTRNASALAEAVLGAAIVVASGLYMLRRETRKPDPPNAVVEGVDMRGEGEPAVRPKV